MICSECGEECKKIECIEEIPDFQYGLPACQKHYYSGSDCCGADCIEQQSLADYHKIVREDLYEYLEHDSWRCAFHQKCHCGLDEITDKLGIRRVPLPLKI